MPDLRLVRLLPSLLRMRRGATIHVCVRRDTRERSRGEGVCRLAVVTVAAFLLVGCQQQRMKGAVAEPKSTAITLYVATDGDDQWSGELAAAKADKTDGPFATLARARDAARALRPGGGPPRPIEILVRGGTYFLAEPFVLTPEDSGTAEAPLTISTYPRERAILSGGVRISGFHETEVNGRRVWSSDVPGVKEGRLWFRELFVNRERRPRTRLPKKGNQIIGCDIGDLGAGGIKIGERELSEETQPTGHNTVSDCHVYDGGVIYRSAVGIWIGHSGANVIAHNHVHDFDFTGISIGWSWGYKPSRAQNNLIEKNHVHHVGRGVLSDLAGIYTLGVSPGTVIRGNVIQVGNLSPAASQKFTGSFLRDLDRPPAKGSLLGRKCFPYPSRNS